MAPTTIAVPAVVTNLSTPFVDTSFLVVNWIGPSGQNLSYGVYWTNGNSGKNSAVNQPSMNITNLTPGVQYNITVWAVASDNLTKGQNVTISVYTRPGSISSPQLSVTTSSISLNWTNVSQVFLYNVDWVYNGGSSLSTNTTNTYVILPNLTSGTNYTITVTTFAGDNKTTGAPYKMYQFTRPQKINNMMVTTRGTDSLKINWTLPGGRVDYYMVNISNIDIVSTTNTTPNTTFPFHALRPGRLYTVTVTSVAGGFTNTSDQASFATYPTPTGSCIISNQTNSSLHLQWTIPPGMNGAPNIYYFIAYQPVAGSGGNQTKNSTETELTGLMSGTLYNINITTVGPENLSSTAVCNSSYTLPNPVQNLIANPLSNTSIKVNWSEPVDVKPYYQYLVTYNSTGYVDSQIVNITSYDITNLEPGSRYCINVTTQAAPGAESTPVQICTYTNPKAGTNLMAMYVSTTFIQLTWSRQSDYKPSYSYVVKTFMGNNLIYNNSTKNESITLYNLTSGTKYTIYVYTAVEGVMSTNVSTDVYTKPNSVTYLTQTEITTNSLTLTWNQTESKPDYSYEVQVNSTPPGLLGTLNINITNSTNFPVRGLESGSNYSFTVTTLTANGTRAQPVTVSYFTRPYGVTNLTATTLNTTAIHLNWTEPNEYKENYSYWVKTTGFGSQNQTISVKSVDISALTPGTNCTFCVSVMAANGIKGEESCTWNYTKPELVQPSIYNGGSNSSIKVSWTPPNGSVDRYILSLNSTLKNVSNTVQLGPNDNSYLFDNLSAGVLYSILLTTCSGPYCVSSNSVSNTTYPNPPGPIEILERTTSSIWFNWTKAYLMTNTTLNYVLTITQSLQGGNSTVQNTSNTYFNFSSLFSGTCYNISVRTQGPMGFESVAVHKDMVCTRPLTVQNLTTTVEVNSITVYWALPAEYKEIYQYNLTWMNPDRSVNYIVSNKTVYTIPDLVPGSRYNISITTETSDGTQSDPSSISVCTNASPVMGLMCNGPNLGDAVLNFTWTKPEGRYSSFQFNVTNITSSTSSCCQHTVPGLLYNTPYTITVETQSCGNPSAPKTLTCSTGITNPNLPSNYTSFVDANPKSQMFTVTIDFQLLDDSHGPITHVGILVTSNSNADGPVKKAYLKNTYDNWKSNSSLVYLATVQKRPSNSQRSSTSTLDILVGNGTKWNGYSNGALVSSGIYKYAIVLFTSVDIKNDLVDPTTSILSITNYFTVVITPQNSGIIAVAVGAALGTFGILLVILIGALIYWRRLSNKEPSEIQIPSMRAKVSLAVRVEDFETHYKKQKADSSCGFAEEYEDLKSVGTAQAKLHAMSLDNKPKNRYNNVLPYDSSRVKLSIIHGNPNEDYINANYMPGYLSRKEYIAAQGPLPITVTDFWRMIWEKNVYTVVMLTRCNEQGRVKCEQYWAYGTKHCDDFTVTITSEITLEDWTIRDFDIKNVKTTEVRSVRQFHFTAWPDHGVPETTELLISFRHLVREHMNQYQHSPTVVHCSAGVGRTGTFIAIDRLIYQIERENVVDVYGIVHDLRMHRPLMVQTEDQYVFLNQCALDIIRSRTGTNVDLIYQNPAAISIYENIDPHRGYVSEYD